MCSCLRRDQTHASSFFVHPLPDQSIDSSHEFRQCKVLCIRVACYGALVLGGIFHGDDADDDDYYDADYADDDS